MKRYIRRRPRYIYLASLIIFCSFFSISWAAITIVDQSDLLLSSPLSSPLSVPASPEKLVHMQDSSWGYELDYPQGWKLEKRVEKAEIKNEKESVHRQILFSADNRETMDLMIFPKRDQKENLIDWVQKNGSHWFWDQKEKVTAVNSTVSGFDAVAIQFCGGTEGASSALVYVSVDDLVYRFLYNGSDLKQLEKLLKSLRLHEKNRAETNINFQNVCQLNQDSQLSGIGGKLYNVECERMPASTNSCCASFNDPPVDHWECSRYKTTGAEEGNCVWWAAHERRDVGSAVGAGDAHLWDNNVVDDNYLVDDCPRIGDIYVHEQDSVYLYVKYPELKTLCPKLESGGIDMNCKIAQAIS